VVPGSVPAGIVGRETERGFPGKEISLPVMGTFEVVDGKIAAWRDYFDMNQFMSQI
jgi:limonene-1,2-epoxide hydrolase